MKILFIERKQNEYVSLEKVFRQIASAMPSGIDTEFQQLPYGLRPWDTIRNLLLFRKRTADIYHITGHINYIALLFSPQNTVLTFHDLRFVHTKHRLRKMILKKFYLDLPFRRLKYITAVSQFTKRELIDQTGCDPRKIRVLGLPVMSIPRRQKKVFDKSNPVLLQIGTMPNKNIERLAAAVSGLPCILKIVGALSESQVRSLNDFGVEYESIKSLGENEMAEAYADADVVTFCSTYEGFGLPIIEAQASGCPVVTSNISPMTETSGGAACLVDPFDVDSIRGGIERVINDDQYRRQLVNSGFENIGRFQENRIAAEYEQFYREIVKNNAEVSV